MTGPRKPELTGAQRQQIERARRVLIWDEEGIAGASASNMEAASYAIAYGRARGTITALLAVIGELTGGALDPPQEVLDKMAARGMRELTGGPVPGVALTPAQLRIVLDALADAADYRRICISQFCGDCADSAPELCADHREAADEAAIGAYEALSAELGGGA
jgi:hypothetical protein